MNMTFTDSLDAFLAHNEKRVLFVTGDWGVGKTHLVRQRLAHSTAIQEPAVSYVSLFSTPTIADLERTILLNGAYRKASSAKSWTRLMMAARANAIKASGLLDRIRPLRDYLIDLSGSERLCIKNHLICLDDLERLPETLPIDQVLGLISFLKEVQLCRVIVLCNEKAISTASQSIVDKYREKIADVHLEYNPTVEHNCAIAFGESEYVDELTAIFREQQCNNIRIMKQALWCVQYVAPLLKGRDSAVIKRTINQIAMIGCFLLDKQYEIDVDKLDSTSNILQMIRLLGDDKSKKGELENMVRRLDSYGYIHQPFDHEILKCYRTGGFSTEAFQKYIDELDAREKRSHVSAGYSELWQMYRSNFTVKATVIVEQFSSFVDKNIEYLQLNEIDQCARLLSDIGAPDKGAHWRQQHLRIHLDHYDRRSLTGILPLISDDQLLAKANSRLKVLTNRGGLYEVISRIVLQSGWDPEDEAYLDGFSSDEYLQWISSDTHSDLIGYLASFHRMWRNNGNGPRQSVTDKLTAALRIIASESELNRIRVDGIMN